MPPAAWLCMVLMTTHILAASAFSLSVTEIKDTGKVLFRELRDSECKVKCKSRKPRIMCGSDNVSYLSKCELKRARRCEGKKVTIKRRGKCSEADVPMTKCFQERVEAQSSASEYGPKEVFIPECTADGVFAQVQCHQASGYCWCVSSDGKPIPKTSTKSGNPNCALPARKRVKRPDKKKKPTRRKKRKGKHCTQDDRARFNTNLVRVFTEEFNRANAASAGKPYEFDKLRKETLDKEVVNWKFSYYDKNEDGLLQKKEVNELRRLVKKFIKPRPCAKRFLKYCDKDRDKLIQRQEWIFCLGVGIDYDKKVVTSPEPEPEPERTTGEHITNVLSKKPSSTQSSSGRSEGGKDHPTLPPIHTIVTDVTIDTGRLRIGPPKQDKQEKDCLTDRRNALEQHADNPDGGLFIPNCTKDGKFARAQCHTSTGYCWCVDEETGQPISYTATVGVMPNCAVQEDDRKIKGCSFVEKQKFINDLLTAMKIEMAEYALDNSTDHSILVSDPGLSLQERVVGWKFTMLDTNKNKKLHASEIGHFQRTIDAAKVKSTRKCARKFVGYCDENGDHTVELTEWQDCLGISRQTHLPSNPKRTGKNPFDQYLRDT